VNIEASATRAGGWEAPRALSALELGSILHGSYRILGPLATGGRGQLFIASHTRLPGKLAIKALHPALAQDAAALARFRREAEITATLRHPHIVQLYDFNVTAQGIPYLVMELLEGRPLAERVATGEPFEPASAAKIIDQMAHALHLAHTRGIVHRDLKPDNVILLSGDGVTDFVKVVDFGISQASWRPRLTADALLVGTPQYMAPEQARGRRDDIDHRSDQFSLAAIAYALLTGCEPFKGDEPVAVLYQVVHENPPPPSTLAAWLPEAVDAVIARGLEKRAEDRYPDILEFSNALTEAIRAERADGVPQDGDEIVFPVAETVEVTTIDPPPPVHVPALVVAEPEAEPEAKPEVEADLVPDPMEDAITTQVSLLPDDEPGAVTRRLIRRVRRRAFGRVVGMSLVALLVFAGVALAVSPTARAKAMDASRHVPGLVDAAKRAVHRVSARPALTQTQSAEIPEPSGPDRDP
jgi:eukaryotic-like serine/threonine-protein kinase